MCAVKQTSKTQTSSLQTFNSQTSHNFVQLYTTSHNFAGVEWSGELPKHKLPTCRLPTRKLHIKCVCGEATFQLTNFHNINFFGRVTTITTCSHCQYCQCSSINRTLWRRHDFHNMSTLSILPVFVS